MRVNLAPAQSRDRKGAELFTLEPGAKLYTDANVTISQLAPELRGLTDIRISQEAATSSGVRLEFEVPEAAQVLVGFFHTEKRNAAAVPPKDEWEPILHNAVIAQGQPAFTVYSHALPQGRSELDFGRGAFVVLCFINKDAQPEPRIVFLTQTADGRPNLDWLFE